MQGNHRGRTGKVQNCLSLLQRTNIWTSRDKPNKGPSGQILLVATTKPRHSRVCQRMRQMPKEQSKHPSMEGTLIPHNTAHWGTPIPNHHHGLYCKTTRIGRIWFYSHHHRPQLYKDADRDPLQRNHYGRRSSWAISATDLPKIWTALKDNQWQGP